MGVKRDSKRNSQEEPLRTEMTSNAREGHMSAGQKPCPPCLGPFWDRFVTVSGQLLVVVLGLLGVAFRVIWAPCVAP